MNEPLNGYVLVDKPAGPTSHSILSRFRKVLGKNVRIGHLGTLDPFATGLLPVLMGGATRLSDAVMDGTKQYAFTIAFGSETDTLDLQGKVVAEAPIPTGWEELIVKILPQFHGEIEQVPPVYSALKMNGRPLYEHMRATGSLPVDIETKKRQVKIFSLTIEWCAVEAGQARLRVVCGKGTYVRSLARDLAKALGTVGTCVELRREAVGPWNVENAIRIAGDELPQRASILAHLLPPQSMRPDVAVVDLPASLHPRLLAGNPMEVAQEEFEKLLPSFSPGPVFLRGTGVMYWGEGTLLESGSFRLAPKKRVI